MNDSQRFFNKHISKNGNVEVAHQSGVPRFTFQKRAPPKILKRVPLRRNVSVYNEVSSATSALLPENPPVSRNIQRSGRVIKRFGVIRDADNKIVALRNCTHHIDKLYATATEHRRTNNLQSQRRPPVRRKPVTVIMTSRKNTEIQRKAIADSISGSLPLLKADVWSPKLLTRKNLPSGVNSKLKEERKKRFEEIVKGLHLQNTQRNPEPVPMSIRIQFF